MGRDVINYDKVEYYPLITSRNDDAPNFSMRFFRINPGGYTNKHKHSFEHEVYVIKGRGIITIDGEKLEIEKDNCFIIHPYETHQLFAEEDVLEFLCIVPNKLKNQPE
jgi:quercetin dioxygenase-like cupin family protein